MREEGAAVRTDRWTAWPVYWDAVWVGALAAIVAAVLFGLIGTALGAHKAGAEGRITTWSGVGLGGLVFAVFASFLAFVIGGWVAARVAGITRAEPAMLHGAIAFLVATVGLLALASLRRSNSWRAPSRFTTWIRADSLRSKVVKRSSHRSQTRRRRIDAPSSASRESMTRVSGLPQAGQCTRHKIWALVH